MDDSRLSTNTGRGARLAAPRFPADLPIADHIDEIVRLLRREPVLVVAGETGSGKTTQLPKACLAAGLGHRGAIAHTQPRRLAARAVATRIAAELEVPLGAEVGYAVRFEERAGSATRVKVMTDGLLLAELQRDPRLSRYDCVIVDEAHERSLNVDFLLGGLKQLLARRRHLKVVVTSATIDTGAFAEHFGGAPVVAVEGRGFPVEIVYRPIETAGRGDVSEADAERALVACLAEIGERAPAGRRDILVFQSGEREIFDNARLLKRHFAERFDILPLYARLPAAQQARVFAPAGRQRVVLATNVAETSLTVPNIGYVVDPGFARVGRYSPRAKLQRLIVEPISQASATQRAGRCGRVAAGVCYRLYAEEDLRARPAYTTPELKRTNLAAVVLALRAFRLGRVETFPFIDPPAPAAVKDAVGLLHELRALEDGRLTAVGRAMARLPVDPRLARMIIEAARVGALREALVVVAALAHDPRLRPLDRQAAADSAHAEFARSTDGTRSSDFQTFLRLWAWLERTRAEHTRAGFRNVLEKRFLSPARVREWRALHRQLRLAAGALGLRENQQAADYSTLHRALLAGSLGFIGAKRPAEKGHRQRVVEYDGPRGGRFGLWPGSTLRRKAPRWVMAAELSDTGRTFARHVAGVEPEWIESAAAHIAKRSHSPPRWDAARGEAVVLETVTVYGLPVASGRPRRAAAVAPDAARELFALEALVRGDPRVQAPFLARNAQRVRQVEARQGKHRRMDLLASEQARAAFYLRWLPDDVCSVAAWRRYAKRATPAALARFEMTDADVLATVAALPRDEDFPPRLHLPGLDAVQGEKAEGRAVRLSYKFAPGEPDDGVTATVDLADLTRLAADALEWMVPGFLEEKCLALVRLLPKYLRRQLAPAPDRVAAMLPALLTPETYRRGSLAAALSQATLARFGVAVPAGEWRFDALPPHLRMNLAVWGGRDRRRLIMQGRDADALRAQVLETLAGDLAPSQARLEQRGLTDFPAAGIPDAALVGDGGARAWIHPVLVDRGDSVDLLWRTARDGRGEANRAGFTRLALLARADARRLRRDLERDPALARCAGAVGGVVALVDALLAAGAWRACFEGRALPTDRQAFHAQVRAGALGPAVADLAALTRRILAKRLRVRDALEALRSPALTASRADLEAQLSALVGADFLAVTPSERLADLPRYLDGMAYRVDALRVGGKVDRDRAGVAAVTAWEQRLAALVAKGVAPALRDELRFLVQEFRMATFSQALGTRGKVSAKRLAQRFDAASQAAGGK